MSSFGINLKNLREENGITQEVLAQSIKVKRVSISGYETGRKEPNYDTLIMIADFLEVSVDDLLGRDFSNCRNQLLKNQLCKEERRILQLLNNRPSLKEILIKLAHISDKALNLLNNFITALLVEHFK